MAETISLKNCLSDEKVFIKYIPDFKNGISDKTHPLYGGLSTNASIGISAPLLSKRINTLFTRDEIEFLSKELNEDLSPNSNFWKEFRTDSGGMRIDGFPIYLKKEGAILNKNNAMDYIKIRILEDSDIVANSVDEIKFKKGCRFVLISEKDVYKKDKQEISVRQKSVKLFGKYEDDFDVMKYILRTFNKSVDSSHTIDFLQKEAWKLMNDNPMAFIATVEDEHLKTKILINDFVNFKLINKSKNLYYDLDGKKLSLDDEVNDINGAARYLDSGLGSELKLELQAKVKTLKK